MEKYIVKAFEDDCGIDLYTVYSDKTKEDTMEILEMASRYAVVDTDLEIDEGIKEYDEYYEEIVNNDECGLYKFEQYVELRGLKIELLKFDFDFEFEW